MNKEDKIHNGINVLVKNDKVFQISQMTLEELKDFLEKLCNEGYKDKIFSCCGCTEFYIHLFDGYAGYICMDTEEDI